MYLKTEAVRAPSQEPQEPFFTYIRTFRIRPQYQFCSFAGVLFLERMLFAIATNVIH